MRRRRQRPSQAEVKALAAQRFNRWRAAIDQRDPEALDALKRLMVGIAVGGIRPRRERRTLTRREVEVLQLIADGYSSRRIAAELGMGLETVKSHRRSILRRLGARTSTHAVALAWRQCLID